jgi:hypothetical protein
LGCRLFGCDEFFDVFAARSWLAGEGFQIPGQESTRGLAMTRLTAASLAMFGESEWSARAAGDRRTHPGNATVADVQTPGGGNSASPVGSTAE